jgi:hypothetical protein
VRHLGLFTLHAARRHMLFALCGSVLYLLTPR